MQRKNEGERETDEQKDREIIANDLQKTKTIESRFTNASLGTVGGNELKAIKT